MPSVVTGIFGGESGTVKSATNPSAINNSISKGMKFLENSRLITAGGLTTRQPKGGKFRVETQGQRWKFINNLTKAFRDEAKEFSLLRDKYSPGFSAFRKSGLKNLKDERRRIVGDLKDNLARRRISGSSFAADAVSRTEAEFQKREDEFITKTFLQELDIESQLIEKEGTLVRAAAETLISELNIQADFGLKLTGIANSGIASLTAAQTSALTSLASQNAAARMESQGQSGDFIGDVLSFGIGNLPIFG